MTPVVAASGLTKTYRNGDVKVAALHAPHFSIEAGTFVAFVDPSGRGKSTLLNLVDCLDSRPPISITIASRQYWTKRRICASFWHPIRARPYGND